MSDRNPFSLPVPPREYYAGRDEVLRALRHALESGADCPLKREDPLQVVLTDIEGCLNLNPQIYDHEVLMKLREVNDAARWDNCLPFITLCTGRQSPFVDAFSAFLSVRLPVIFEGGCGLFFPANPPGAKRNAWHPLIASAEASGYYDRLVGVVTGTAHELGATASLGKGRLLTYHPGPGMAIDHLVSAFVDTLAANNLRAEVSRSANAVDISIPGVTKGTAVDWLLETIGDLGGPRLLPDHVIGIGDAPNDLSFLAVVGASATPACADSIVKDRVSYTSPYSDAKAVADVIVQTVAHNQGLSSFR